MPQQTVESQDRIAPVKWYRTAIPKEQLRGLTARSNLAGLLQIGSQLALAALIGVVFWWSWYHWPWWLTVLIAYGYGQVFGFIGEAAAGHELSHQTPFKSRPLNEFFLRLTAFLTWSNYIRFRISHREHHKFTAHYPQELEVVLPKTMSKLDWLLAFVPNPVYFVTNTWGHVRRSFGVIHGPWEKRLFPPEKKQLRRNLINWSRLILAGHILLAAIFIYFQLWPLLVLITFGVYLGSWLVPACTMPQHVGLSPNTPDFRLCTRTMYLGPLLRFLYWNMNYHIEHHMYASVPFHRLAGLHEAIRHDLPPVKKGIIANWREMIPAMARQRKQPDFFLRPELPPPSQNRD